MKTLAMSLMLLTVLLVAGCGKAQVNPAFQSYLADFNADAVAHAKAVDTKDISISFGEPKEDGAVGECQGNTNIVINEAKWDVFDDVTRKILIYHELGHCALNLQHTVEMSIMRASLMPETYFESSPETYLKKLFN